MIEVDGLTHAYGRRRVLDGVSFRVGAGEVVGFLGANGAGKSTTLRILLGMLAPTAGLVRVAGLDPTTEGRAVKALAGYVPESGALYEAFTPREYLLMVGRLRGVDDATTERRGVAALEALDLAGQLDARMTGFSKGMKQKVLIASAVVHDPRLLLLDEPLNGLDAHSTWVVKEIVRGLASRGTTVLYSSHLLDVVERVSERVLILDGGRIVADGPLGELKARGGDTSLEALFRRLTAADASAARAATFLDAMGPARPPPGPVP